MEEVNGTACFGEYVLSPCGNTFNEKTSYWLSKKGMTTAMYCFTISPGGFSYEEHVKEIDQYIQCYKNRFERPAYGAMLVTVCERDITTEKFASVTEAYKAMEKKYNAVCHENNLEEEDEYECGIEDMSAWATPNCANYDWKIVEL